MVATFGELIQRARSFVRDTDGGYIDDEDLAAWINEAYKDIAARLEVLQREITGMTSGFTINLPTVASAFVVQIMSLRLGTVDVQFVNSAIFDSWKDSSGSPPVTLGRVFDNVIELYPTPDDATAYVLRIAYIPNDLVDSADEHVLSVQLERKLVEYSVAQAKYKDDDPANGDRWFSRYEQGLPEISRGKETGQPGPLSFSREPTYFELDAIDHRSSLG